MKKILFIILCIGVSLACSKITDDVQKEQLKKGLLGADKSHQTKMVTKPFKANFYTKRDYSKEEVAATYCTEDPFIAFNYQVGEGEATHLGHFTTEMQFCGAGFDYNNMEGTLVAANGDELYVTLPEGTLGHVILYTPEDIVPPYDAYFADPFIFIGGTGRFEGATGEGMMHSQVNLFEDDGTFIPEHQTDHVWTGTIILMNGK